MTPNDTQSFFFLPTISRTKSHSGRTIWTFCFGSWRYVVGQKNAHTKAPKIQKAEQAERAISQNITHSPPTFSHLNDDAISLALMNLKAVLHTQNFNSNDETWLKKWLHQNPHIAIRLNQNQRPLHPYEAILLHNLVAPFLKK